MTQETMVVEMERALIKALKETRPMTIEYWDAIDEWARAIATQTSGDSIDPVELARTIAARHNLRGIGDWEYEFQLYISGCPEKYVLPFTLHWLVQRLALPETKEAER